MVPLWDPSFTGRLFRQVLGLPAGQAGLRRVPVLAATALFLKSESSPEEAGDDKKQLLRAPTQASEASCFRRNL